MVVSHIPTYAAQERKSLKDPLMHSEVCHTPYSKTDEPLIKEPAFIMRAACSPSENSTKMPEWMHRGG
jgi:hypothetical protein